MVDLCGVYKYFGDFENIREYQLLNSVVSVSC